MSLSISLSISNRSVVKGGGAVKAKWLQLFKHNDALYSETCTQYETIKLFLPHAPNNFKFNVYLFTNNDDHQGQMFLLSLI